METVVLTIHMILALALIVVVLLQRSEGRGHRRRGERGAAPHGHLPCLEQGLEHRHGGGDEQTHDGLSSGG